MTFAQTPRYQVEAYDYNRELFVQEYADIKPAAERVMARRQGDFRRNRAQETAPLKRPLGKVNIKTTDYEIQLRKGLTPNTVYVQVYGQDGRLLQRPSSWKNKNVTQNIIKLVKKLDQRFV